MAERDGRDIDDLPNIRYEVVVRWQLFTGFCHPASSIGMVMWLEGGRFRGVTLSVCLLCKVCICNSTHINGSVGEEQSVAQATCRSNDCRMRNKPAGFPSGACKAFERVLTVMTNGQCDTRVSPYATRHGGSPAQARPWRLYVGIEEMNRCLSNTVDH